MVDSFSNTHVRGRSRKKSEENVELRTCLKVFGNGTAPRVFFIVVFFFFTCRTLLSRISPDLQGRATVAAYITLVHFWTILETRKFSRITSKPSFIKEEIAIFLQFLTRFAIASKKAFGKKILCWNGLNNLMTVCIETYNKRQYL